MGAMKKVVTAEQLRAYKGRTEVCLEEGTILTPSAQDAAREMGLTVRIGDCEVQPTARNGTPALASERSVAGDGSDLMIVAAFGPDRPGILAGLTACIAEQGGNIRDVSQTILQGYFSLILSVATDLAASDFAAFKDRVKAAGAALGLEVSVQKQAIFQAMHRI